MRKAIEDYDTSRFSFEDAEQKASLSSDNQHSLHFFLDSWLLSNSSHNLYSFVDFWLNNANTQTTPDFIAAQERRKQLTPQERKDWLFGALFRHMMLRDEQTQTLCVIEQTFKHELQDEHCAYVWEKMPVFLPPASTNLYRQSAIVRPCMDIFSYKFFKHSLVESSIQLKNYGFLSLLRMLDKNAIHYDHLAEFVKSPDLTTTVNLDYLKLPKKYNRHVETTTQAILKSFITNPDSSVKKRHNQIMTELLERHSEHYVQENFLVNSYKYIQERLRKEEQQLIYDHPFGKRMLKAALEYATTPKEHTLKKKIKI